MEQARCWLRSLGAKSMMAVDRIEVLPPGKNRHIHRIADWVGPEQVWTFWSKYHDMQCA